MRILFVTSSLSGGGAERVISILANKFIEYEEIESVSLVSIIENKVDYFLSEQVNYMTCPEINNRNKIFRIFKRVTFLRKIIKKIQPDIIISFATQINIYALVSNIGLKSKVIISERNDPNNDPTQKIVRKLRDYIYSRTDGAVFQTPDAESYFSDIIKNKSRIILNPINENLPSPYLGEREKRIVTVARLHPAKNISMLIHAFTSLSKKFPEYILDIYGEGPEEKKLEELVNSLNMNSKIKFKGYTRNIHNEILKASCFVLPSNYEGISNAMLESLAIGVPTICTDCPIGGARMVISHMKNGILTPVGDQASLERMISLILTDDKLQKQISKQSVEIKQVLTSIKISQEWLDFSKNINQGSEDL